ncbi:lipopolysaccharide-induced tumor necrosis factor-alpha factor homolog [Pantherophis guttatus]|uniref:Lipopolysaccharide-induced tumor necrosis factor-alpha factor homolog n=1 Tax=Pantherophis guttatus TaxID=94885 RepID=A0A6P9BXV0_PANGU|nr:lipopolysaccharide-induced tumor necrosis factor-alpha factor homolog [Pantherophis guttatus]
MSGIKMSQEKEKISVPMVTLSVPQEPYAPGYSASYTPEAYTSQSYNPQMYAPQAYSSESQSYKQYTSDPYAPNVSETEHYRVTDACCYDVSTPPPYSCEEVPCDTLGPVCMDSSPPVVVAGIFSSKPASTICPCCRQIITTEVVFRVGCLTYAVSTCLCLVGCCLGCCLIPFMSKCCKDVDHYCPCCRYHIYRYKRI